MSTNSSMTEATPRGVWRLTHQGEFQTVRPADEAGAQAPSSHALELMAQMALERLPVGGHARLEAGSMAVLIERDEDGVLLALSSPANHSLLVRASMRREETRSRRSSEPAPTSWGPTTTPRAQERQSSRVEQHDDLVFEIVFDEDSAPAPSNREAPAEPAPAQTWARAAALIERSLERGADALGASVLANYWRQELRQAQLGRHLEVTFGGQVRASRPSDPIDPDAAGALARAWRGWLDRCDPYAPDVCAHMRAWSTPWPVPSEEIPTR